jgi:hypothetical protein
MSNDMGGYRPMSTGQSYNQFGNAYQAQQQLINRPDYINAGNLMHNNMGDKILDTNTVEYKVFIDSVDRDPLFFPDPFKFVVRFRPQERSFVNGEEFTGDPAPHIPIEFRNVKYIKIVHNVLPLYSAIMKSSDAADVRTTVSVETQATASRSLNTDISDAAWTDILTEIGAAANYPGYSLDSSSANSKLLDDRFISLKIKEIQNERLTVGTNNAIISSFGFLIPDKAISTNYYITTPYNSTRIFQDDELMNLKRLTIDYYDSFGSRLEYKIYNVDSFAGGIDFDDSTKLTTEKLTTYETLSVTIIGDNAGTYSVNVTIPTTDVRHPLNKTTQNNLFLLIGVKEPKLNRDVQFDR